MPFNRPGRMLAAAIAVLLLALAPVASRAETLVGSNVDARVILAYAANPEGVASYAPEGWAPIAFPSGPLTGANLLLVLIDRLVQLDAEGKPVDPASSRFAVLVGLAAPSGGGKPELFVYRILSSDMSKDPYSNSVAAEVDRQSAASGPANGGRARTEIWTIASGGGQMAIELSFTSGRASWGPGEAFPRSAAKPEFSRIYRYNQLVDLVTSTAVGKPLSGSLSLVNSIPELSAVFDGSETLVGIMDIPVYTRQVFLP